MQRKRTARRSTSSARRLVSKKVGIALTVATAATVLGSVPSASAGTGNSYGGSVVTDVRTATTLDFAAGAKLQIARINFAALLANPAH